MQNFVPCHKRHCSSSRSGKDAHQRLLSEDSILLREILSRTWFLERVLKLNLVPIAKEYTCVRNTGNVLREI